MEAAVRVIARSGVRGLRVEELAAEAGVSTALIYYHFKDRAGLVRRTLEFINDRATAYTDKAVAEAADARDELEQLLLTELQDTPQVRENSTAWGELRASAIFEPEGLRDALAHATQAWVNDVADAIRAARSAAAASPAADPVDSAERLTALVEGLSERWLSGSLPLERARELLSGAIALELGER
ncbi:TetR/AcrR family transcriptional regulator [Streptomyces sp. NPDC048436]|uniref:TetR/AcrR family transcriptional regulator n=1 Tax=Streptomyces sp. NPDC048436 TaxID=3365550 RepID=UPI0037239C38